MFTLFSDEILVANDAVTRVMTLHKEKVEGEKPVGDYTAGATGKRVFLGKTFHVFHSA